MQYTNLTIMEIFSKAKDLFLKSFMSILPLAFLTAALNLLDFCIVTLPKYQAEIQGINLNSTASLKAACTELLIMCIILPLVYLKIIAKLNQIHQNHKKTKSIIKPILNYIGISFVIILPFIFILTSSISIIAPAFMLAYAKLTLFSPIISKITAFIIIMLTLLLILYLATHFSIGLSILSPIYINEKAGLFKGIEKSFKLTKHDKSSIFVTIVLPTLLISITSGIIQNIFIENHLMINKNNLILSVFILNLLTIICLNFIYSAMTIQYHRLNQNEQKFDYAKTNHNQLHQ